MSEKPPEFSEAPKIEATETKTEEEVLSEAIEDLKVRLRPFVENSKGRRRGLYSRHYKELYTYRDATIEKFPEMAEFITAMVESFCAHAEWYILNTHLVVTHGNNPEMLTQYWDFLQWMGMNKTHIIGARCHAGAYHIFEELGLHPQLPTAFQDAWEKTDLIVQGKPVQVKSASLAESDFIADLAEEKDGSLLIYINAYRLSQITAQPEQEVLDLVKKQIEERNIRF